MLLDRMVFFYSNPSRRSENRQQQSLETRARNAWREQDVHAAGGLDTGPEADMRRESERECHRVKAEKGRARLALSLNSTYYNARHG